MELSRTTGLLDASAIRIKLSTFFLWISRISLGAAVVFLPMHYRWVLQLRSFPPVYEDYTNFYLYLADIPLACTLIFWLFGLACAPRRLSLRPYLISISLAGLILISAISGYFSVDPRLSAYYTVRMLVLYGVYLYLVNELSSLRILLIPLSLQILLQAVVGIAQVLRQHSLGLAMLQELVLDPSKKGISTLMSGKAFTLRAYGLTDHPNILGGSLAFALVLLAAGYLGSRPTWRPWIGAVFAIGSLALLVTFSRSAWVGLLGGLGLLAFWMGIARLRSGWLSLFALCGATLIFLLPFIWNYTSFLGSRLNLDGSFQAPTSENQSIQERFLLFAQAKNLIYQYPWTGVGMGAYAEAFHQKFPDYPFTFQPPHLVAMEAAAETGIPGALIYLFALAAPWYLLLRFGRRNVFSISLACISAALLAISLVSFFDYYPWLSFQGRTWQWLIWGAWGGIYQTYRRGMGYD